MLPSAPADLPSTIHAEEGEHRVTFHGSRVIKRTKPGTYGLIPTEDVPPGTRGPLWRLGQIPATPAEYLQRHVLMGEAFGVHSRFEGIEHHPGQPPVIVTSQPLLPGVKPEGRKGMKLVAAYMRKHGFRPVEDRKGRFLLPQMQGHTWYHPQKQLLVSDVRLQNFMLHQGKLTPFDLLITRYRITPRLGRVGNEDDGASDGKDDGWDLNAGDFNDGPGDENDGFEEADDAGAV